MTDRIFATVSILALIAYTGIVMWFVAEPDLIIVVVLVLCLAVHDFWQSLRKNGTK